MDDRNDIALRRDMARAFHGIAKVLTNTTTSDPESTAPSNAPIDVETSAFAEANGETASDVLEPMHVVKAHLMVRLLLIADTLSGIATVAEHGHTGTLPISYTGHAVARTTLDAAAHCYWLAEPDIGYRERTRRLLQDITHDLKSTNRIRDLMREDGVELPDQEADLVQICDAYHVTYDGVDKAGYPKIGDRPPAWKAIAPLMPSEQRRYTAAALYSTVSDIAHASVQGILRTVSLSASDDSIDFEFSPGATLNALLPVMWALPNPLHAVFSYLGWDDRELRLAIIEAVTLLERHAPEVGHG